MTRNAYYIRLNLAAGVLLLVANVWTLNRPWHMAVIAFAGALIVAALVLMYLVETGRSTWNGPKWGTIQLSPAKSRRLLVIVPALCAVVIPVLILLNGKLGLSDTQIGFACGVLLGISLTVTFKLRSRGGGCAAIDGPTQQSGTE